MAGEAWRRLVQVGKESTYGVAVPATRQLLMVNTGHLDRQRAAHVIKVTTGTPDNVRGVKNRAVTAGGTFQQPIDADEIVELFLASVQGGVTPTATAAIANPTTAATATGSGTGGTLPAATYTYVYTDVGAGGMETAQSSASTGYAATGTTSSVALTGILAGAAGTLQRKVYRSNGGAYGLITTLNDNTTTAYTDTGAVTQAQALLNGSPPASNQTGTGGNVWTFKPGTTLDSQTWEWRDAYNDWNESGVEIDQLKFTWNATATGDSMVDVTLFGKDRQIMGGGLTGSLSTRAPIWMEGWETQVFIDPLGTTPGTTPYAKAIMGDLTIKRNLGRKYFATNTQATGAVTLGEFDLTGSITLEGDSAAVAQFNNWDASTAQMFLLRFGNNGANLGATLMKRHIDLAIPAFYTADDLSGDEAGTKVMKFALQYSYSTTDAFSFAATVVNSRTTAYA